MFGNSNLIKVGAKTYRDEKCIICASMQQLARGKKQ